MTQQLTRAEGKTYPAVHGIMNGVTSPRHLSLLFVILPAHNVEVTLVGMVLWMLTYKATSDRLSTKALKHLPGK